MIHVVTVHFLDDRWIGPQLRFLHRHLEGDHATYGCLNGIDPRWNPVFDHAWDLEGSHADKLNELARRVIANGAHPDDLLIFVDGDAFPVAPIGAGLLSEHPLAAVRRDELMNDCQPHPCFCVTTVGLWDQIKGDWREGHAWPTAGGGTATDVGGNLLGILEREQISWRPLLRSNRTNLDDLWFGIYADVVYHHGAGFRVPKSRQMMTPNRQDVLWAASKAVTPAWVPVLGRAERSARFRFADYRHRRHVTGLAEQSRDLADGVFRRIETDDEFFRMFQAAPVVAQ